MKIRSLGTDGPMVSAIGLGCMGMSAFYGATDEARVRELAAEHGITPGQLALAWVLAQGEDIVPIPGTKRRSYLEENLAAADVELSAADLARIAGVVGEAAGERYDPGGMATLDR